MKPSQFLNLTILCLTGLLLKSSLTAQSYTLAADSSTVITVTGTSTLHGWTVTVNEIKDVPNSISISGDEVQNITDFSFGVVINSMDGGRGASMNTKIKNALQAKQHPIITFQQNEPAPLMNIDENGNFKLISKGILNMVGLEKIIEIEVTGQKTADGLVLIGSKPLKFSEFSIEPPSAMFGQIVCGDDIAVNFEFRYKME